MIDLVDVGFFKMEDSWDSQMMMGVGMGDLRGMHQQPSCSRQDMQSHQQEMSLASPEQQDLHHHHPHHQDVMGAAHQNEYFGNQVSLSEAMVWWR